MMRPPDETDFDELFPADCHFKVIAVNLTGVLSNLNQALQDQGWTRDSFKTSNLSSGGKYISYEISLRMETRLQMKDLESALKNVEGVKMVL